MARTSLTKTVALGSYGNYATAGVADLTMTAADISNLNQFVTNGNDLVIAHNTGASAYTITITSMPDPFGRTKDIAAYQLDAGDYAIFGPFALTGWVQTDGKIYLQTNNAAVKLGVVQLPG
jgi:hypothetical protein